MKETCRAAIFEKANQPQQIRELKIPQLNDGEMLIKNEYATLCRSDLNTFTGKRQEKTPTILGHEIVGRIDAFGPNAPTLDDKGDELAIGDRITWSIFAADPDSPYNKIGIPQKGSKLFKYGHEQLTDISTLHGGLAEHTVIRKNTVVFKIDEVIPLPVAAIINCAVATVSGSMRMAGELKDKNVLVSGAGMLGIIACAMAENGGARNIIAVDMDQQRLETAEKFGANYRIPAQSEGILLKSNLAAAGFHESVQIILEYSGSALAMESSLHILDIGGTAVWIGATFPQRPIQIDAEKLIRNIHTIKGLHNYNEQDLLQAVEFIHQAYNKYPFQTLIHDAFTLDDVNDAFNFAISHNPHRAGIRINHVK
jgi:putative phosphonate catabolism associated alcohol dehydrogenase